MPPTPPLEIVRGGGRPIHLQLAEALRAAILDGRFGPADRLPPIRQLAGDLGVARTTVVTAYEQLAAEGYLVARVGSGTRVAPELPDVALRVGHAPGPPGRRTADRLGAGGPGLPAATYWAERGPSESTPFDFRPGRPAYGLFPAGLWERLLRDAWRELAAGGAAGALDYPDPGGLPRLRRAIADHLRPARGVRCRPDQVAVLGGSQAAFVTAARLWLGPGRVAVVEDPGYPMARRALAAAGARIVARPVDAHGLPPESLPAVAAMAVVTPSWQFPLGGTLPAARRLALLEWATRAGAVVIEDDYDSELRYAGRPLAALQGLDDAGRVLYVGTFSKVAFPALRIGFAVVPERAMAGFAAALELLGRGAPILEQLALARFIEAGAFERHLRRARVAYAGRQAALVTAIRRLGPGRLDVEPASAGMHLVARLAGSGGPGATQVAAAAARAGVRVIPVASYRVRSAPDRELLLGYPALADAEIAEGVRRLVRVIDELAGA